MNLTTAELKERIKQTSELINSPEVLKRIYRLIVRLYIREE